MLTLQSGLMRTMDTDHLIYALECEPQIMRTPVELELMCRCYALADERDERIDADKVREHIADAATHWPDSDFLNQLSERIFELAEQLDGDNKIEARAIAKELTELNPDIYEAKGRRDAELAKIFKD